MGRKPTYEELEERVKILEKQSIEHKRAEEALRESKERYSLATRAAMVGVWDWNVQTGKFYLDPNIKAILGYSDEEIPNDLDVWATYVHPDDKQAVMENFQAHLEGKTPKFVYEHRMLHKDGSVRWILARGTAMRDAQGNAVRVVGTDADITLRKRAEEALQESEEKYRLLVENANDAIFIVQDEKIEFPNPKAIEMNRSFGLDLDRVPFFNYIHPEDRDMVLDRQKRRIKGEKVPNVYTFRLINEDGEEIWVELNAALISWEGQPATLNFLRDITPLKRLETQLQQVRRLEALGTLAGGIAHDFNNLLMGIQGRVSLMTMETDSSYPHYDELKDIEDIVGSGADLTKQLLGFARSGKYDVKPTDLNELIGKTSTMFGRIHKGIRIHPSYQEDIWAAEVDRGQIEQVLLNLYVNAWQAMPGGGELYLQTTNVTLDENHVKPYQLKPDKFVKISVTDTGVGMDESTRQRIFEPFFTTKEMGRGTGLGLASAYGVIRNHGGFIDVSSEKGQGSNFTIYLPASEKDVIEEKSLPEKIIRGTETILLVDDEDKIIDIGDKTLRKMDYQVLSARSGKEAIELYSKKKDTIDIVVLDMIMPEMGGGETYDRLKEINPDVKVILSSGYSITGQASEILERGCDGFIQKPFKMGELSQKIREILDKK